MLLNQKTRYKYFSLIIKILIGLGALGFILVKLKHGFHNNISSINNSGINYGYIFMALTLMLFNWGIETYKWNFLIKKIVELSFFKAFKIVITGITISLITPNRIGEIPGRVYLLNRKSRNRDLIWLTTMGSFTQLVCTVLFGGIGLMFTYEYFHSYLSSKMLIVLFTTFLLITLLFFAIPFFARKIKSLKKLLSEKALQVSGVDILQVQLISVLRYFIFFFQYLLILWAFNINVFEIEEIMLIPVCFFVASIIPTILLSEIGVRSSVAIFIFGMVSDNTMAIVLSSVVLWTINIALPGLLGILNLNQLKIFNR